MTPLNYRTPVEMREYLISKGLVNYQKPFSKKFASIQ
jgi:hypothetical protein